MSPKGSASHCRCSTRHSTRRKLDSQCWGFASCTTLCICGTSFAGIQHAEGVITPFLPLYPMPVADHPSELVTDGSEPETWKPLLAPGALTQPERWAIAGCVRHCVLLPRQHTLNTELVCPSHCLEARLPLLLLAQESNHFDSSCALCPCNDLCNTLGELAWGCLSRLHTLQHMSRLREVALLLPGHPEHPCSCPFASPACRYKAAVD